MATDMKQVWLFLLDQSKNWEILDFLSSKSKTKYILLLLRSAKTVKNHLSF